MNTEKAVKHLCVHRVSVVNLGCACNGAKIASDTYGVR